MGAFLQMDRITLYEFSQDRAEWAESFTWTKEGAQAGRAVMKAAPVALVDGTHSAWRITGYFELRRIT